MLTRPAVFVLWLAWRNSSEKPAWGGVRNQPEIGCFAHDSTCQLFRIGQLSEVFRDRLFVGLSGLGCWKYTGLCHDLRSFAGCGQRPRRGLNTVPSRLLKLALQRQKKKQIGLTPVSWRGESLGSGSLALRHDILRFLAFFGSAPGGAILPSRPAHCATY